MGVSYYASLVYGVPYAYDSTPKTVTRYNEITGKPYPKTVGHSRRVFKVVGTPDFPEIPDELHDEFIDLYIHGGDEGFVGTSFGTVDPNYGEHVDVNLKELEQLQARFESMCDTYFPDLADILKQEGRLMLVGYGY